MSKILEIPSKAQMADAALSEASSLLRELAGERRADESVKAVLLRVQRKLSSWSASRVRCVWYSDKRISLREGELAELRAKAARKELGANSQNDLMELRQCVSRLVQLLEKSDPTFHGPQISALRGQILRMDGENRTSD